MVVDGAGGVGCEDAEGWYEEEELDEGDGESGPSESVGEGAEASEDLGSVEGGELSKEELEGEERLDGYPLLPAVRGHLLQLAGRNDEARSAFLRAASLSGNERERELLLGRAGKV